MLCCTDLFQNLVRVFQIFKKFCFERKYSRIWYKSIESLQKRVVARRVCIQHFLPPIIFMYLSQDVPNGLSGSELRSAGFPLFLVNFPELCHVPLTAQ